MCPIAILCVCSSEAAFHGAAFSPPLPLSPGSPGGGNMPAPSSLPAGRHVASQWAPGLVPLCLGYSGEHCSFTKGVHAPSPLDRARLTPLPSGRRCASAPGIRAASSQLWHPSTGTRVRWCAFGIKPAEARSCRPLRCHRSLQIDVPGQVKPRESPALSSRRPAVVVMFPVLSILAVHRRGAHQALQRKPQSPPRRR